MMRRLPLFVLTAAVLLVGLPAAAQSAPKFEPADCWFDAPAGATVECGFVPVPENRNAASSREIRLAVAVIKSRSAEPQPEPAIFLQGGPGASIVSLTPAVYATTFAPHAAVRDVIVFDQRGTGLSQPALTCPEFSDAVVAALRDNLSVEQEAAALAEATRACASRLTQEGVDLAGYNSAQNAADVADVLAVLGYEQAHLFGGSYGSRLGFTVMRDFPEIVRSAALGSIFPLQANLALDTPVNTHEVLNQLFDACAADADCNTAFPDLKTVFYDTVARLNAEPVTVQLTDPRTGEPFEALVNGDEFVTGTFIALYASPLIGGIPQAVYAVASGDTSSLTTYLTLYLASESLVSRGMYLATQCYEDIRFNTSADYEASFSAAPGLESYFRRGGDPLALCAPLNLPPADPIENQAVTSDIPVLLLSGEFDPATPPKWGDLAAETLSNSRHIVFPGLAHDTLESECPTAVVVSFFADPTAAPDTACLDAMTGIQFSIPGRALKLVPFSSDTFGITGVIPEGWQELRPGTYGASQLASTVILQQALAGSSDDVISLLKTQLGLDDFPASSGSREANGFTWALYELTVQGQPSRLALTDRSGMAYLVLLVSTPSEIESFTENLFLPAVDAYQPQ